jgi:lysophospholipase L1-like esterase
VIVLSRACWLGLAALMCSSCRKDAPPSPETVATTETPVEARRAEGPGLGSPEAGSDAVWLVHFVGRFDVRDPAGPRFAWPGTALVAAFTGTGLDVRLHDSGTNFFSVVIDDKPATTLPTSRASDTYTLASGLSPGRHTVVLTKRTEAAAGVVQFQSLQPSGGALVPSPAPFARHIEYIGDSITSGLGILGAGPTCRATFANEDETMAFGALAAARFHADASVIAYPGGGLYRNAQGFDRDAMPWLFGRTLPDDRTSVWGFPAPPPDVVVIQLGTNDFERGDPGFPFQQAFVDLFKRLRVLYPNAYLIAALSPMLSDTDPPGAVHRTKARAHIQTAVRQRAGEGDARVSYVEFDEQSAKDGYGCNKHPSFKTQQRMAVKLAAAIHALTGW